MSLYELIFGFTDTTKVKFPWVFSEGEVDRHGARRTVPMEVLSLGMGRTGTASMQKALTRLGYQTSHGFDMYVNKADCDMWMEAFNAKYHGASSPPLDVTFWDQLLGHKAAVTDTPANCFAKELIESYPEAKVILVERNIDSWYTSFERALIQGLEIPFLDLMASLDKSMGRLLPIGRDGIMRGQFGAKNPAEYRRNAKPVYRKHYAEIRALLKDQPNRLLEYELGSGWKPLCTFLNKPVPDDEFPRVNESAVHDEMGRVVIVFMVRKACPALILWMMPVLSVLAALVWRLELIELGSRFILRN